MSYYDFCSRYIFCENLIILSCWISSGGCLIHNNRTTFLLARRNFPHYWSDRNIVIGLFIAFTVVQKWVSGHILLWKAKKKNILHSLCCFVWHCASFPDYFSLDFKQIPHNQPHVSASSPLFDATFITMVLLPWVETYISFNINT